MTDATERVEAVARSVELVRTRVEDAARASGRDGSDVRILAAVKYVDAPTCAALLAAGIRDLAENRLAALVGKQDQLGAAAGDATWHFIGRLQSREAVQVASRVRLVHSLCTGSSARRLAGADAPVEVLVQVNVADDPAKDGVEPAEVERFVSGLPDRVVVEGLMTMPAFAEDPERSRGAFAALRELRDALAPRFGARHPMRSLSMGTSQDFAVAVEEGATHVRLGRILHVGTK